MNFDVGFFGLPYGENVSTTRIVYDPTIIIYHIPEEPGVTWAVFPDDNMHSKGQKVQRDS